MELEAPPSVAAVETGLQSFTPLELAGIAGITIGVGYLLYKV